MEGELKEHCATCAVIGECKRTFGSFWRDRSRDGVGCNYRFPAKSGAEARRPEREGTGARRPEASDAEARREPWEIAHVARGPSAGIMCMNKRNGMARQGRLL